MSWFQAYKYVYNTQTEEDDLVQLKIPLRRKINISNLKKDIQEDEQVYANLQGKSINSFINSNLETTTDNYSYIVVYQDDADEDFFKPVQSKVIDNILYFKSFEDINKETIQSKYYAVYYGVTNIKYIEETIDGDDTVFVRPNVISASDFDIVTIEEYTYTADESSEIYSLAYYNSGIDWKDGISQKVGAKAFGVFDGPKLQIYGSKGKSYGKFRVRIFSYSDEETISSIPAIDWVEVDCYSGTQLNNQILYQIENLEYNKYIFEIEVLSNKNTLSSSNSVNIDKYMFSPDYGLFCDKEEINPSISFVTIAGVR